jgi:transposase
MVPPEIKAEFRRLYIAERLTMHAIAQHFGVHPSTVSKYVGEDGQVRNIRPVPKSQVDPYMSFITEVLKEFPRIRATRLHQMIKDRGFKGTAKCVRDRIRGLRPKTRKAFLPQTVFAGEEAQVDWASFGTIQVGKAERKLSCFLMVLSHSRASYGRFTYDQSLASFLLAHEEAFRFFGGVPRRCRYDNLKSAVIERHGQAVRYNDSLLEFAGHYCFKPSACNPFSGHEKGRVERLVRYFRDNFFAGRIFRDIDDANRQLMAWIHEVAHERPWPDDRERKVKDVFAEEQSKLLPLPKNDFAVDVARPTRSGKLPYVRHDLNDYSIPYQMVQKPLSLIATEKEVRILDGQTEVARHVRSYSKGERISDPNHFAGLYDERPGAATTAGRAYMTKLIPEIEPLYSLMVVEGVALGSATAKIMGLVTEYGEKTVREAVKQAVERGLARPSYLAQICAQRASRREERPQLPIELPHRPFVRDLLVTHHDPSGYDDLADEPPTPEGGK